MAHTRRTLHLTREGWDITLDGVGRIALIQGGEATAQNVANEARLFTDDAYFAQDRGVPHFLVDLGRRVNHSILRSYLRRAALTVPDVAEVQSVQIAGFDPATRRLTGDIQFTTREDASNAAVTTSI